jgi:adenylosuccinate lyase
VLLKLIEKGMERQAAYVVVQRNAMKVWDEDRDFKALLAADPDVQRLLNSAELEACFDLKHELRHVDAVFDRVLKARG